MAQPTGDLPTQREAEFISVHGPQQVRNPAGGYNYALDDLKRFRRYLIIGSECGMYNSKSLDDKTLREENEKENIQCLDRLLSLGRGGEVLDTIKEVSVNRLSLRQDSLLNAYAICCRNNDDDIKQAAYAILNDVCRIPTQLFIFTKYCQENTARGTGWGRCHKRAISNWYKQFHGEKAEQLATLVTKYKMRIGWSHKDVIRLAHTKCRDEKDIGMILRYIVKGYRKAEEYYIESAGLEENDPLKDLAGKLKMYDDVKTCENVHQLCSLIRANNLSWEHLPSCMLNESDIWTALLPRLSIVAMIRNLGRMTNLGLFPANSKNEQIVLKKLKSVNQEPDRGMKENEDDEEMEEPNWTKIVHPFRILIAYCQYKDGRGEKSKRLTWIPNQAIVEALDEAFYNSFQKVEPTGKKFCLAVDVSESMDQPVFGSSSIKCSKAAAAMMMMTARTEDEPYILGFSEEFVPLSINREDSLTDILKKTQFHTEGNTDCARPMLWAMSGPNPKRDIDVFIVYTDNETWFGNVHPAEALRQYRQFVGRQDVKLIVCGMCATNFTIADEKDKNMLDIVGFDSAAPRLISEFVKGNI